MMFSFIFHIVHIFSYLQLWINFCYKKLLGYGSVVIYGNFLIGCMNNIIYVACEKYSTAFTASWRRSRAFRPSWVDNYSINIYVYIYYIYIYTISCKFMRYLLAFLLVQREGCVLTNSAA